MILYSERDSHYSHRVRIVLAEKDIASCILFAITLKFSEIIFLAS